MKETLHYSFSLFWSLLPSSARTRTHIPSPPRAVRSNPAINASVFHVVWLDPSRTALTFQQLVAQDLLCTEHEEHLDEQFPSGRFHRELDER